MKKWLALLLAIIVVFSLVSGCSSDESSPTPTESKTPTSPVSADPDPVESDEPDEIALYPIMDEKTEFSIWSAIMSHQVDVLTDYNDIAAFREIERLTNIHIKWIHPALGNEQDAYNMLLVAQDYPDAINYFSNFSTRGLDNAIEEQIAIELTEVIDNWMPDYKRILYSNDAITKNAKTDSGKIVQLYCIYQDYQPPWYGLTIRKDWLDDLGLDYPETYDDWYIALKGFKEEKGATEPLLLYNTGDTPHGHFAGGYGVINGFYNADGIVKYGPLEPGYKEYLQTFAKWYHEGLIDPDFNTRTDHFYMPDTALIFNGRAGAWAGGASAHGTSAYTSGLTKDPNFEGAAIRNPVKNKGDITHFRCLSQHMGVGCIISTNCEDVETLARWFNYFFSEEGTVTMNYGIENETFVYIDGKPRLSKTLMEEYFDNEWSKINQCAGPVEFPYYRSMDIEAKAPYDYEQDLSARIFAREVYGTDRDDWLLSEFVSPTNDEASEIAIIMGDINTFVAEKTLRYILGVDSFDNYETDFVEAIKEMNIDTAIELTQQYVTRYINR